MQLPATPRRSSIDFPLLLIGIAPLAALYLAWGLCDTLTELGGDSATYLLMARHLSPFVPADPLYAQAAAGSSYPPLFPLLIGLLGAGFTAAHALVAGSLILAWLLFYRLLRARSLPVGMAAAAVALFALMPGTYLLALNIWSENTYLALSLLALLMLEHAQQQVPGPAASRAWWAAAGATAATVMTRTAGLPLLLTFTWLALRRQPRRWLLMLLAAWLPLLAWTILSHPQGGGGNQYITQLTTLYAQDPIAHLRLQLQSEAHALVGAWLGAWLGVAAPIELSQLAGGFGLIALAGWLHRLRQGSGGTVYLLLYLLMLLIWPWPGEAPRLLYVVTPLLIGHGLQAVRDLSAFLPPRERLLQITAVVVLALPLMASALATAQRRLAPVPTGLEVLRHIEGYYSDSAQERHVALAQAQLIADMRGLAARVPAGDCIFQIKPSVTTLLSGRRSLSPPLPATDDRIFAEQLRQCRYAYVMRLQSPTFPIPFYPMERLGAGYDVLWQLQDDATAGREALAELIELSPQHP